MQNKIVPVKVYLTHMLVRHLNMKPEFNVDARNLSDLLDEIDRKHLGFRDSVCDESGRVRVYVNVFLNGQNVGRDPDALCSPLADGDEVHILASVAGGTGRK